ncbi:hypothetical protein L0337_34085 [candidate division KSB1 bacterium]|nr:hypothetical protein [candidate division KSB1 bacterium]
MMKMIGGNNPLLAAMINVVLVVLKSIGFAGLESRAYRQRQQIHRVATLADKASSGQFFNRVGVVPLASWAG